MNDAQRRFIEAFDRVPSTSPAPVGPFYIPRWLEQAFIEAGMTLPANAVVLHGPPRYHQLHPDHRGP